MNFEIIKTKTVWEIEQRFTFQYINRKNEIRQTLGCIQGNINDPKFVKQITRWRGKMIMKNVSYEEIFTAVTNKQVKRMNNMERWSRKQSRVFNEYIKQVDKLKGGIFYEEELKKLSEQYKETVKVLKKRYAIETI